MPSASVFLKAEASFSYGDALKRVINSIYDINDVKRSTKIRLIQANFLARYM